MSRHPMAARIKSSWWREFRFNARNFISGRLYKAKFNTILWFKIQARRKKAAKYDPVWKESWWCLERRYTKLAKRHFKLELKYIKAKDEIKGLKKNGRG